MKHNSFLIMSAVLSVLITGGANGAQATDDLGVLHEYSQFYGVNETCKLIGFDNTQALQDYLARKVSIMKSIQTDPAMPAEVRDPLGKVIALTEPGKPEPEIVKAIIESGRTRSDLKEVCGKFSQVLAKIKEQDDELAQLRHLQGKPFQPAQ